MKLKFRMIDLRTQRRGEVSPFVDARLLFEAATASTFLSNPSPWKSCSLEGISNRAAALFIYKRATSFEVNTEILIHECGAAEWPFLSAACRCTRLLLREQCTKNGTKVPLCVSGMRREPASATKDKRTWNCGL